jgi:hypothetical protein
MSDMPLPLTGDFFFAELLTDDLPLDDLSKLISYFLDFTVSFGPYLL